MWMIASAICGNRVHQAILHHVRQPVGFVERRVAGKPDVQVEEGVIR